MPTGGGLAWAGRLAKASGVADRASGLVQRGLAVLRAGDDAGHLSLATSKDLRALKALVDSSATAGGVTAKDAEALLEWGRELGVRNMHGLGVTHLRDTPWKDIEHIKLFGVHLPVLP